MGAALLFLCRDSTDGRLVGGWVGLVDGGVASWRARAGTCEGVWRPFGVGVVGLCGGACLEIGRAHV